MLPPAPQAQFSRPFHGLRIHHARDPTDESVGLLSFARRADYATFHSEHLNHWRGFVDQREKYMDGQQRTRRNWITRHGSREICSVEVSRLITPSNLTSLLSSPIIILLHDWGRQASTGAVTFVAMHAVLALCSSL